VEIIRINDFSPSLFLDTHEMLNIFNFSFDRKIFIMYFMTSPILKGNEKNKITPDVMLLKIDHWANIATPTTVVIEESAIKISLVCTPK
jgi:hypothetical protein